jgi:hypothetical protein
MKLPARAVDLECSAGGEGRPSSQPALELAEVGGQCRTGDSQWLGNGGVGPVRKPLNVTLKGRGRWVLGEVSKSRQDNRIDWPFFPLLARRLPAGLRYTGQVVVSWGFAAGRGLALSSPAFSREEQIEQGVRPGEREGANRHSPPPRPPRNTNASGSGRRPLVVGRRRGSALVPTGFRAGGGRWPVSHRGLRVPVGTGVWGRFGSP